MEPLGVFPDELVEEILSRLPARYLLQLRCVSKTWCALIDSYGFIKKHHQKQYVMSKDEGNIPLFLDSSNEQPQFHLFSRKRGDVVMCLNPDVNRDSAPRFSTDSLHQFNSLRCMGVVNGVVCLRWWQHYEQNEHLGLYQFGLWNPVTREFKDIPHPRSPSEKQEKSHIVAIRESLNDVVLFGMGFDPKSNNFKIVRSAFLCHEKVNGGIEISIIYEIYSCDNNSWKSLCKPLPNLHVDFCPTDGSFNSIYYWTGCEYEVESYDLHRFLIVSFDFTTEEFKLFDPPPSAALIEESNWNWMVGQYKDQLAMTFRRLNIQGSYFEIWAMCKDDDGGGVGTRIPTPLSWQHLFTVGPILNMDMIGYKSRVDDDLLLTSYILGNRNSRKKKEAILYYSSMGTFKKLGFPINRCFSYVESLFPISKRQVPSSY